MEWVPAGRLEIDKVAVPLETATVARTVTPSINVTVPVGVPEPEDVTAAMNVTAWPYAEGFWLEDNAVVVGYGDTICAITADELASNVGSPA